MKLIRLLFLTTLIAVAMFSCNQKSNANKAIQKPNQLTAMQILGNPNFLAMSYGGYRNSDHAIEPTIQELKEDMKIMFAMGVKILRTYKVHLPHASNVLKAISELKQEDSNFEMYVMLGAWINCKNAFTEKEPEHDKDNPSNETEIKKAVALANQYPDIVKIIAVGNEAMVRWQAQYYVKPWIILKWVNYLQDLKKTGKLNKDLWITSSDNFASWGGGDEVYQVEDLNKLIKAVDFISMHTYPMHDTHYNPDFWGTPESENNLSDLEKIHAALNRSLNYAKTQHKHVSNYVKSLGVDKPIHIGESGWATRCDTFYGANGSKATDEYKSGLFYGLMRDWSKTNNMSCFYFEAFDEPWKGGNNPQDSEKHFGLFTVEGEAKFALWNLVDTGIFNGLTRSGNPISKTYNGNINELMVDVLVVPSQTEVLGYKPN